MALLDPRGPWVWLLYLLMGAAIVSLILPKLFGELAPDDREVLKTMPLLRAGIYLLCIVCWPVLWIGLVLDYVYTGMKGRK